MDGLLRQFPAASAAIERFITTSLRDLWQDMTVGDAVGSRVTAFNSSNFSAVSTLLGDMYKIDENHVILIPSDGSSPYNFGVYIIHIDWTTSPPTPTLKDSHTGSGNSAGVSMRCMDMANPFAFWLDEGSSNQTLYPCYYDSGTETLTVGEITITGYPDQADGFSCALVDPSDPDAFICGYGKNRISASETHIFQWELWENDAGWTQEDTDSLTSSAGDANWTNAAVNSNYEEASAIFHNEDEDVLYHFLENSQASLTYGGMYVAEISVASSTLTVSWVADYPNQVKWPFTGTADDFNLVEQLSASTYHLNFYDQGHGVTVSIDSSVLTDLTQNQYGQNSQPWRHWFNGFAMFSQNAFGRTLDYYDRIKSKMISGHIAYQALSSDGTCSIAFGLYDGAFDSADMYGEVTNDSGYTFMDYGCGVMLSPDGTKAALLIGQYDSGVGARLDVYGVDPAA